MSSHLKRFTIALMMALTIAGFTLIAANAQTQTPPPVGTSSSDCGSCHPEYYSAWQGGAHSKTRTEHVMQEASNCVACHTEFPSVKMPVVSGTDQPSQNFSSGQMQSNACTECHVSGYDPVTGRWKEDGVACVTCHNPVSANHPEGDIPVDKSTDLCRKCHTETRFGWDAWKSSVHFQNKIVCATCHDSHSTSFKLASLTSSDASALCQNCHKDVAQNAKHSVHFEAGVTCIKCHVGDKKGPDVFHQVPDHGFAPKLETCNNCHAKEMHSAAATPAVKPTETSIIEIPTATATPVVMNVFPTAQTSKTPAPANLIGFIGMAAVLGLAGGIVISMTRRR